MKELLKELCSLDGVAGYEDEVREAIMEKAAPYAAEMTVDPLGNLIVFKKGAQPRKRPVALCAHMDEVGFLVRDITSDGMIRLATVGGIDPRVLVGRRMKVGPKKVPGVISIKAIHLTTAEDRKTAPGIDQLYVDIGAQSRAEVEKLTQIGDPVFFDSAFYEMGDRCVKSKAIDDRVGCAVLVTLLQEDLPYDTYFVFSVGEEVGRGSVVAAQRLNAGTVCAVEGTSAADIPDVPKHGQSTAHRAGAVVSIMDKGTVYDRELYRQITAEADRQGVRWQYRKSANGGTDAGSMHKANAGARAFGLAAPTRYIHCACNVVHLPDVDEVVKMARIFIKETGENNV